MNMIVLKILNALYRTCIVLPWQYGALCTPVAEILNSLFVGIANIRWEPKVTMAALAVLPAICVNPIPSERPVSRLRLRMNVVPGGSCDGQARPSVLKVIDVLVWAYGPGSCS